MSDPLRVAFVVEGPTDYLMLKAVVERLLEGRDFSPQVLQPEMSAAFQPQSGEHGFGWPGVCRWCLDAARQAGGRVSDNYILFRNHDLVVVQLDAEAAREEYSNGHLEDPFPEDPTLPCDRPCPPPAATTDRLRSVILKWLGEEVPPPGLVLCTPSRNLEAWVLVGLFPQDPVVRRRDNIECRESPESILQGKPAARRLVSRGKKDVEKYREAAPVFAAHWEGITRRCAEAARFNRDLGPLLAP